MYQYKENTRWKNTAGVEVSEGVLFLGEQSFRIVSGGGGKGPLPSGDYKLMPCFIVGDDNANKKAYMKDGLAFFSPILPQFKTDRTLLGIHPDGGVLGTLGCLGLQDNISIAYKILSTLPKEGVMLEVKMIG